MNKFHSLALLTIVNVLHISAFGQEQPDQYWEIRALVSHIDQSLTEFTEAFLTDHNDVNARRRIVFWGDSNGAIRKCQFNSDDLGGGWSENRLYFDSKGQLRFVYSIGGSFAPPEIPPPPRSLPAHYYIPEKGTFLYCEQADGKACAELIKRDLLNERLLNNRMTLYCSSSGCTIRDESTEIRNLGIPFNGKNFRDFFKKDFPYEFTLAQPGAPPDPGT